MVLEYLKNNKRISKAVEFLKEIQKHGYQAYIVGGVVRDMVKFDLDNSFLLDPIKAALVTSDDLFHDIDIATNMPIQELQSSFETRSNNGEKHGTILVQWGTDDEGKDVYYEVTQFRKDGKYLDARRPEDVTFTDSFFEDVMRRDFTMNALGLDAEYTVIDHVNGIRDIINKTIMTVGDPVTRFCEDSLRVFRALRFKTQLGWEIDPKVSIAIQAYFQNPFWPAAERITEELLKCKWSSSFIEYLIECGFFLGHFKNTFERFLTWKDEENDCITGEEALIFTAAEDCNNPTSRYSILCKLRFTNKQKQIVEFIRRNCDIVNDFWANPWRTLKAVGDEKFHWLNKYWKRFYPTERAKESVGIFEVFLRDQVVDEKLVNSVICKKYKGPKIGIMKEKVINAFLYLRPKIKITEKIIEGFADALDNENKG